MNTNRHREKDTFGGRRSFGWGVNIDTVTDLVPELSNEKANDARDGEQCTLEPATHFYALCDVQLAERCSVPYRQLEGRIVTCNMGDGLHRFVGAAVADLGLSARHVSAVTGWMIDFQRRPPRRM